MANLRRILKCPEVEITLLTPSGCAGRSFGMVEYTGTLYRLTALHLLDILIYLNSFE